MALYDVTDCFNRSLARARRERGEPTEGVERALWEAAQLPRKSLEKLPGWVAVSLAVAGLVALWRLSETKRALPGVPTAGQEQEKAA